MNKEKKKEICHRRSYCNNGWKKTLEKKNNKFCGMGRAMRNFGYFAIGLIMESFVHDLPQNTKFY